MSQSGFAAGRSAPDKVDMSLGKASGTDWLDLLIILINTSIQVLPTVTLTRHWWDYMNAYHTFIDGANVLISFVFWCYVHYLVS